HEPPTIPETASTLRALFRAPIPAAPVMTKYKELRHIPRHLIARYFRPTLDQNKPRQFAIHLDRKWMSVKFMPVKGKVAVAESAIRTQIYVVKFAEVVRV